MNIEKLVKDTFMEYLSGIAEEFKENEIKVGTYTHAKMTIELLDKDNECVIRKYRKNNQLLEEVHYSNFKRNGIGKKYHTDGSLSTFSKYKNDKLEYLEEYWKNGVIKRKAEYRNGRLNGKVENFDSTGKCISIKKYKNGHIREVSKILDNGRIETTFDSYGTVIKTRQFVNNTLIAERDSGWYGTTKYYDINGNLIATRYKHNNIRMSDMYKI
jgi:antitoxin component YwqK of YwqJK toxin-antitoxin module